MRRFLCIMMCLCMASTASALSITNGDFEIGTSGVNWDIRLWYDYGDDTLENDDYGNGDYEGPFQFLGPLALDGNGSVFSGERVNEDEDGGNHAYIYQSIGFYDGTESAVDIELDWTVPNVSYASPGELGVTVMILEKVGAFEPNEWDGAAHDIYGFVEPEEDADPEKEYPIKELGRGTAFRWVEKGDPAMHERFQIDLSDAAIGNELFLRFNAYRGELEGNAYDDTEKPWVVIDNIEKFLAYVLNQLPKDAEEYVAVELDSDENDLVFKVTDSAIIAVDVLFGTDPNLSDADRIETKLETPAAGQYTIDLEGSLPAELLDDGHLQWSKDYYWKILAYESDGGTGYSLKYTGLTTSFKTIQYGPFLDAVTPDIQAVWAGDDAEFTLEYYNKVDTFQWYKEGVAEPLENGEYYAGVDSNTLTVLDCRTEDEGFYYCKGYYTEAGPTVVSSLSETSGELAIKELKSHYAFSSVNGSGYTMNEKTGVYDLQLMGGASLGSTDPVSATFGGNYLVLDNPRNLANPDNISQQLDYAVFADNSVAHHKEITISCWVKPEVLDLDWERFARIFDFGKDKDDFFYLTILHGTNRARLEMRRTNDEGEANERSVDGYGPIGYGTQWLFVAITIEDGKRINDEGEEEDTTIGKVYINGEHRAEGTVYNPSEVEKTLSYLGKAVYQPTGDNADVYPNFNGCIDELKIYNYAQTAEQIAQEYMAVRTDVEYICNMDDYVSDMNDEDISNDYDFGDWDYDGSCQIDLADLAVIAEKWLLNYYFIYPN